MRRYDVGADRGNQLVRAKGLGHQSNGAAGQSIRLSDIDHDTRAAISSLLARGVSAERVAAQIGVSLTAIRLVARLNER